MKPITTSYKLLPGPQAMIVEEALPRRYPAAGSVRRLCSFPAREWNRSGELPQQFSKEKILLFAPRLLQSLSAATVLLLGCRTPALPGSHDPSARKTLPIRGRIVATSASGAVTLAHEAIPGYMDAMTMPYKLAAPNTVSELHPGDRIAATLVLDQGASGDRASYRNPRLEEVVIIGQARPDYVPKVQYHVPQAGDPVPDFQLINQSGSTLHLSQFKGQALLLTFIYTRCPLPDFCPRMSENFARIDRELAADPRRYAATHLLSISFDPTYDTPAVLRSYGASYTHNDFRHWDFAAVPSSELPAITQFFNVGLTPGDDPASLTHSLSTVLIGKDGRISAWFPTNDWTPDDVLARLRILSE